MAGRRTEEIWEAVSMLESAAELDKSLDVATRRGVSDADAVAAATQASDAYMASCAAMMSAMGKCSRDARMQRLLSDNIKFVMDRIDKLQTLLQRKGSATRRISLTPEEVAAQRTRARISQPTQSDDIKRGRVATEILETERSYVRALENLRTHFMIPLTSGAEPILSKQEASGVFGNVTEILGLAQSFAQALEAKIKAWGPNQTLGDTFKTFAMFFKIYVMYTNSFKQGVDSASSLLRSNERARQVASSAAMAGCQDIGSLMINPIQRLPRYVLLLKELRKRTPDTHPDARLLESALADIQVVADHVNEKLGQHEDNAKMLEIQSALWTTRLGGVPVTLLAPGRMFIQQGKMLKVRSIGTLREVHLFLFSDILLYASSTKFLPGRYHYHNHLEFYGASEGRAAAEALGANHPHLDLAFKVTSQQAIRVFIPSSAAERDEWVRLINECARNKRELDARRNSQRLSASSVSSLLSSSTTG